MFAFKIILTTFFVFFTKYNLASTSLYSPRDLENGQQLMREFVEFHGGSDGFTDRGGEGEPGVPPPRRFFSKEEMQKISHKNMRYKKT